MKLNTTNITSRNIHLNRMLVTDRTMYAEAVLKSGS
jgi:hypothetical protein